MEHKKIQPAIIEIMKACSAIGKNRKNDQQRYNFRGIDDVANELHEHFSKNGVFILPEVQSINQVERQTKQGGAIFYTTVTVKYTFMAEDGSAVYIVTAGEGMDSADKSTNKAMSAALKYALLQMLLIPTEEKKDSENDSYDVKSAKKEKAQEQPVEQLSPAQFQALEKMVDSTSTIEDLQTIWKSYPQYQKAPSFKALISTRKESLNQSIAA